MSRDLNAAAAPRRDIMIDRPPSADGALIEAYERLERAALRADGNLNDAMLAFAPLMREAIGEGGGARDSLRMLLDRFCVNTFQAGLALNVAVPTRSDIVTEGDQISASLDAGRGIPGPRRAVGPELEPVARLGTALRRFMTIVGRDTAGFTRIDPPENLMRCFSVALACGLVTRESYIPDEVSGLVRSVHSEAFLKNERELIDLVTRTLLADPDFTASLAAVAARPPRSSYSPLNTSDVRYVMAKLERVVHEAVGVFDPHESTDPLPARMAAPYLGLLSGNFITFPQLIRGSVLEDGGPRRVTAGAAVLGTLLNARMHADWILCAHLPGVSASDEAGKVTEKGQLRLDQFELDLLTVNVVKIHSARYLGEKPSGIINPFAKREEILSAAGNRTMPEHARAFAINVFDRLPVNPALF